MAVTLKDLGAWVTPRASCAPHRPGSDCKWFASARGLLFKLAGVTRTSLPLLELATWGSSSGDGLASRRPGWGASALRLKRGAGCRGCDGGSCRAVRGGGSLLARDEKPLWPWPPHQEGSGPAACVGALWPSDVTDGTWDRSRSPPGGSRHPAGLNPKQMRGDRTRSCVSFFFSRQLPPAQPAAKMEHSRATELPKVWAGLPRWARPPGPGRSDSVMVS